MIPLKRLIQRLLPPTSRDFAAGVYRFGFNQKCNICGWPTRGFRPLAVNPSFAERCSRCGSLARHRLLWMFLQRQTALFSAPMKLLHFSPEACIESRLRGLKHLDYTTADIAGGYTPWMETLDVTAIAKPDKSYDAVLCIHVLQAVEDDLSAIREIHRVLKPGGWAILNSRCDTAAEKTLPHPDLPSAEERARAVQQDFAYRIYGRDFARRLEEGGFDVEVVPFRNTLDADTIRRYFLETPGDIYLCRKPQRQRA